MDDKEVTEQEYIHFVSKHPDVVRQEVTWSSPCRTNLYLKGELVAYRYGSYGEEHPATFFIL